MCLYGIDLNVVVVSSSMVRNYFQVVSLGFFQIHHSDDRMMEPPDTEVSSLGGHIGNVPD